ncbi:MAG: PHB depolymerase family esterase [Deltaproteobacteria bacterium]|nr:PHB depolymerase family esterase [Deltaproteobacteria bacterium]
MTRAPVVLPALVALSLVACGPLPTSGDPSGGSPETPGQSRCRLGAALEEVKSFGANPGGLAMFVHAPPGGTANAVVVAMHGCTQSASDYTAAGWNELADRAGFAVVYPQQSSSNNMNRCFNWFEKGDIARGQGEARSIASMTEHALATYGAKRAFVTGLSAGAAMTAVMLATYPDLFEAGAIMAGIPYGCASTMNEAFTCMSGKQSTPSAWAALVPNVEGATAPRVSIFHGTTDWTVRPSNMTALVGQWTAVNGIASEPTATSTEGRATHAQYQDGAGVTRVETWSIEGMSHGVAVSPSQGCGRAGAFVLDVGLCSTMKAAEFFGLVDPATGAPVDPPPPSSSGTAAPPCE